MVDGTVAGTVAFTDVVGFTEFCATAGDDAALELVTRHERLTRAMLPDGARLVKELGDGMMLWFPEAAAAVRACVELQRRIDDGASTGAFPLWVRMGLHSGTARRRGDDLIGHDVNVASRVADLAGPREVLVSERTRTDCGDLAGVSFTEVGPVIVKGVADPVWIHRAEPS